MVAPLGAKLDNPGAHVGTKLKGTSEVAYFPNLGVNRWTASR